MDALKHIEPDSAGHGFQQAARLQAARSILEREARAVAAVAKLVDTQFALAVQTLLDCQGQVIVCGMGKAGLVGQKISATLASTGTKSIFLHPAEAVHGDLGRVDGTDVVLILSYSGETEELTRLLPMLRAQAGKLIAITSSQRSTLGSFVDVLLPLGKVEEACPLGLAPSSSTTAMLALGDALALVVSQERGFTRDHFARFHPAGSLGRKLTPVDQVMRPLSACRVARSSLTVCEVLVSVSRPGRRSGAVLLTDTDDRLVGIFTDSDLAKLLEKRMHGQLDQPIHHVMTTRFRTIASGSPLTEAMHMLGAHKISELPVIDSTGRPLGLIDITDLVSLVSQDALASEAPAHEVRPTTVDPRVVHHDATGEVVSIPIRPVSPQTKG